nr:hypothetical protein [Microseira wollei]
MHDVIVSPTVEEVISVSASQEVVVFFTIEGIVARTPFEGVIILCIPEANVEGKASPTTDQVIAVSTIESVITSPGIKSIPTVDKVIPAIEGVITRPAIEGIIASPAIKIIVASFTIEVVRGTRPPTAKGVIPRSTIARPANSEGRKVIIAASVT